MKTELDDLLCQKYPKIFRDRHADMRTTCMCWGFNCEEGWFNLIDILCQSIQNRIDGRARERKRAIKHNKMIEATRAGDMTLFDAYYKDVGGQWKDEYLQKILAKTDDNQEWGSGLRPVRDEIPQVVATQVKEKFGSLRFYFDGGDDEIWAMVGFAEIISGRTCEQCGAPGKTVGKGWIKTLCSNHYREGDAGTEREITWKLVDEDEDE